MSLKNKLLACLGFFGLATLLLIGAFYASAKNSERSLSTVLNDRVVPLQSLKTVADSYAVLIVDSAHKARNGSLSLAQASANVRTGSERLHQAWKQYRATAIDSEEEQLASSAEQRMRVADAEVAKLGRILDAQDRPALDRFVLTELYQSIDPVSDALGKLVDLQITIASSVTTGALSTAHTALLIMMALAVAATLVLGVSFYTVTRKVVQPIKQLAALIGDMAKQSGEAKLPHLTQRDEIGDISRSVDAFLGASLAKERQNAAAAAATQALVTNSLAEGLSAMAIGDLTRQVTADFPPAYQTLKTNFNEALAALCELIGSVSESTASIKTGSGEIAHASEDLARRTESNAASLEQTSAALAQIDGRLRASSQAAARTVERTNQAISTVSSGRAIASEAVEVMGRVSDSAKGIDSVIEGLDKIAFQTRVLAMNAAVEAGRAGEAGRGFAVVADLVGALAMRSEEEAKQARDQLTATQSDIVTAVEAVQKVDGAFADISGGVGEVHQLVGTMAADNQAQSAAITEISAAVSTMDQSTQQNAAMVEETSAAARNLTSEVTALTEQAARFTIHSGARARPRAQPATASAKASTYGGPVKPLPAAAIAALVPSGEDWNEF